MKAVIKEYVEEVHEADEPCCHPMEWALREKDIEIKQKIIEKRKKDIYGVYYFEKNYILAFYLGRQEIECCPFCNRKIEKGREDK